MRDGYLGALGYSVFAFVDGYESRPARLRSTGPAGWPVFATLAPRLPWPPRRRGPRARLLRARRRPDRHGTAQAEVRRLTDSPVPLYLASYAEGAVDLDRVGRLASPRFNGWPTTSARVPFAHYTMHQELLTPLSPAHEYGMSMEHLGSSTYYLAASAGTTAASTAADDARVLYNFAHHIAHAWVPKRAYGQGYFPFQWELAPVLDSIWFAEGFGQYAAIHGGGRRHARPGGVPRRHAASPLPRQRDDRAGVPETAPLVDLSRVASTRYAEDFRTGRLVFSRGGLMAAAIDDRIQARPAARRACATRCGSWWRWTAREHRAFSNEELPALIREATGVDVSAVIEEWLRPLP